MLPEEFALVLAHQSLRGTPARPHRLASGERKLSRCGSIPAANASWRGCQEPKAVTHPPASAAAHPPAASAARRRLRPRLQGGRNARRRPSSQRTGSRCSTSTVRRRAAARPGRSGRSQRAWWGGRQASAASPANCATASSRRSAQARKTSGLARSTLSRSGKWLSICPVRSCGSTRIGRVVGL